MKRQSVHILLATALLLSFLLGQAAVYGHSHLHFRTKTERSNRDRTTAPGDDCQLCAQHYAIATSFQKPDLGYVGTGVIAGKFWRYQLILYSSPCFRSSNRGPPPCSA